MAISLKKVVIPYSGTVCRQGEPASHAFFVSRGECRVVMTPKDHAAQFHNTSYNIKSKIQEAYVGESATGLRRPKSAFNKLRVNTEESDDFEVGLSCADTVIGDVELVLELSSYIENVIANTHCILFSLDKRNFERLIAKKMIQTFLNIRQAAELKIQRRLERVPEKCVELLKHWHDRLVAMSPEVKSTKKKLAFQRKNDPKQTDLKALMRIKRHERLLHRGPIIQMDKLKPRKTKKKSMDEKEDVLPLSTTQVVRQRKRTDSEDDRLVSASVFSSKRKSRFSEKEKIFITERDESDDDGNNDGEDQEYDRDNNAGAFEKYELACFRNHEASQKAMSALEEKLGKWYDKVSNLVKDDSTFRKASRVRTLSRVKERSPNEEPLKQGMVIIMRPHSPLCPKGKRAASAHQHQVYRPVEWGLEDDNVNEIRFFRVQSAPARRGADAKTRPRSAICWDK